MTWDVLITNACISAARLAGVSAQTVDEIERPTGLAICFKLFIPDAEESTLQQSVVEGLQIGGEIQQQKAVERLSDTNLAPDPSNCTEPRLPWRFLVRDIIQSPK